MFNEYFQTIREGLRAFINQRNGSGEVHGGLAQAYDGNKDLTAHLLASKAPIFNNDGSIWQHQNDDGTLPLLRGYDYPADLD